MTIKSHWMTKAIKLVLLISCIAPGLAIDHDLQSDNKEVSPFYDFRDADTFRGQIGQIAAKGYFALGIRYIHPPRVEWIEQAEIHRYELILTQNKKLLGVTEAKQSPQYIEKGWDKITRGQPAQITIIGYNEQNKKVAVARMFPFYVATDFDENEASKQKTPYREAAIRAFEYLYNYKLPEVAKKPKDGPASKIHDVLFTACIYHYAEPGVYLYSFPSLHDCSYVLMIESMLKIANESLRKQLLDYARSGG